MQVDVGGKGINVASCLADFEILRAVTGQIGRENATSFETLFHAKGIDNCCFYLDGLTRINTKLVGLASGQTTDVNMPGPALMERLLTRLDGMVGSGRWVVLAGSLPPHWPADTYQGQIAHVQKLGASGAALAAGTVVSTLALAGLKGPLNAATAN